MAVKQANPDLDELAPPARALRPRVYAGNDDMLLDVLDAGRARRHLRGQPPGRAAAGRDGPARARPASTSGAAAVDDAPARALRALFVTTNPIPVKAALNLLGQRGRRPAPAARHATDAETAVVAAELGAWACFREQAARRRLASAAAHGVGCRDVPRIG